MAHQEHNTLNELKRRAKQTTDTYNNQAEEIWKPDNEYIKRTR